MRKLTYFIATSLDGFIAGPDGGDPVGPGGFFTVGDDYVEALVSEYPETLPAPARQALGVTAEGTKFDAVLQGRMTYQIGLDAGLTNAYPQMRQHVVFSRTLGESPDPEVELVSGDPVARVKELKQETGKDIWLCGGASLAGVLYGEIDELIIKLNPVIVRSGIPLFSGPFEPACLTLTDSRVLTSGVAFLTYSVQKDGES